MCMASSSTGLVQQPQPLWVRKYHSPAKDAASQRFFPNGSCSASRGLFCDQLLQGQKVIAFPAVPVWRGLWVVLGLLCTGSSVRTWSSTSYLSPRKCGRGVFLSQHLFCFPNADTQLWIQHSLESLSTAILSNGHGGSWWITPPAFDCMKAASQMHLWPLTPSSFSLLLFSLLHYFLLIFGYNLLCHVDMEDK